MDLGLEGRVYAVTAATRGLGFASAEALVADGARVVLTGRGQASVDEAVKQLAFAVGTIGAGGLIAAFGAAIGLAARNPRAITAAYFFANTRSARCVSFSAR